jgi:tRNA1(Val) A37 N6-methylase TrmN6
MKIKRAWAMPNKHTFDIKPIEELIWEYVEGIRLSQGVVIDPFANKNTMATITNDLDTQYNTHYNMDALDFLKTFDNKSVDMVLYDPPYSPRQVSECYKKLDMTVNMQTTQSSYWGNQKKEIARIIKDGGYVITCGWNSGGIGKTKGFEIVEILLVAHGGWHNDTIVIVERKVNDG